MIDMKAPAAMKGMKFRMQVGVMDCLSCGNCVDVCPGNPKAGGPAWANSLLEDFCEFGLGMTLANKKMRARIVELLGQCMANEETPAEFKEAAQAWLDGMNDAEASKAAAATLKPMIEAGAAGCPSCAKLVELSHYLVKRSQWIIGGDGASYDIGYGDLDHVIASG